MAEKDFSPLTQAVVRGLNDKLYEKRKTAALEVERLVREAVACGDMKQVARIATILTDEFAVSHNPNSRKGGLIGLAATAIALGKHINDHLSQLVPPVLACFCDQDSRVRYYACEALYNISKASRGKLLMFFNRIFDGLSKLAADPDPNVKNGAELLDRLMKDIVAESSSFNIEAFMDLLRERIYTSNPFVRQFLVSWVRALDSVPQFDVIPHLPVFIDGLFVILSDDSKEIRKMCQAVLGELLSGVKQYKGTVSYAAMINIIALHSQSTDQLIQLTAVQWMKEFLHLAGRRLLPYTSSMLAAILPCVSYTDERQQIHDAAMAANQLLLSLIGPDDDKVTAADLLQMNDSSPNSCSTPTTPASSDTVVEESASVTTEQSMSQASPPTSPPPEEECLLHLQSVVDILTVQLLHKSVETRSAGLRWMLHLHLKTPKKIFILGTQLFPVLLKTLSDTSDKVVLLALEMLAELSSSHAEQELSDLCHPSDQQKLSGEGGNGPAADASPASPKSVAETSAAAGTGGRAATEREHGSAQGPSTTLRRSLSGMQLSTESVSRLAEIVLPTLKSCGSDSRLTIFFTRLICSLLSLFSTDRHLLDKRGSFIIRQLCLLLHPKDVYCALASVLSQEEDLHFASVMVQHLNSILLTSGELFDLREEVKKTPTKESCIMFSTMFRSWSHSAVATLSLCLLAQAYRPASQLVRTFGDLDVTVNLLTEIDRLVQMIESPIFTHVRLHLLEPHRCRHLVTTLYGILLLLPQTSAFQKLHQRLQCIPTGIAIADTDSTLPMNDLGESQVQLLTAVDFDALQKHFSELQARHTLASRPTYRRMVS
ncbi:protein VAC14 homolog [Sycon ciliatum]|uniref:protein VAC14 homolog n=1 Tax=Sycon ciliatum TaxID=27933 RepID=UPI0031F694E4